MTHPAHVRFPCWSDRRPSVTALRVHVLTVVQTAPAPAGRLIEGGGVRVNLNVVSDKLRKLDAGIYVVQVDKRKFVRVTVN